MIKKKFSYTVRKDLKTGLILGICISIATQILTWLGYGLTSMFVILTYILIVLFIIIAQRNHWLNRSKPIPFIKALISVLIIIIVSRYVFQLYMYIYITYIDPNWINDVSVYWTELLRESNTPQESIAKQIEGFKKAYQPSQMFTIEIIKYGFSQIILGLITSIYFMIKKPSATDEKV